MRRLTLILSDLYLPVDPDPEELAAQSEHAGLVALPEFEASLRFSRGEFIADWRRHLAAEAGGVASSRIAPAPFAAAHLLPAEDRSTAWFATPVHLEARLDHVRLARRGLLRIAADERRAWREEFARSFGPGLVLHDAGARGFLLTGLASSAAESTDPARLLGADIATSLPPGRAERRLSAEIEMWLHGAALNRERERAGVPRVTSLWLWGGGPSPHIPAIPRRADVVYAGEDPWLAALSRAHTGVDARPTPTQFADLPRDFAQCRVELAANDDSADLARLESQWFAPARAALAGGALEALEILANDRRFITRRHDAWRFWRRKEHWMNLLRRPHRVPQA